MNEDEKKKLSEIYAEIDEQAKNITAHEAGDTGDGKIIEIKMGIVKDFVKEENRDKWKGSIDTRCIEMEIETPDKTTIKQVMTFSGHPNSNMRRWRNRYGKHPDIGDIVKLRHDGNFWKPN